MDDITPTKPTGFPAQIHAVFYRFLGAVTVTRLLTSRLVPKLVNLTINNTLKSTSEESMSELSREDNNS